MKLKNIYFLGFAILLLGSCGNDDDAIGEIVPPKLVSEVVVENDEAILSFLKTHFYNYEEFENPPADFDFKIKFDTIAGDNAGMKSIFETENLNGVEFGMETISVSSSEFTRTDDEVIDHTLYYLIARQGILEGKPTIGDNVIIRYEGSLLDGTGFDASSNQPVSFNLSGVVRGFGNGMEYFQTGNGPIENGDGTVSYEGYGIGVIFMPSGLGYLDGPPSTAIPAYAPLVFKIDAFAYEKDTDLDGDGIPSIQEDLNGDGNLNNDNTDSETEPFQVFAANYNDPDDDNDGILTSEEILIDGVIQKDENGIVIFPDTDGDGIVDHLDDDQ